MCAGYAQQCDKRNTRNLVFKALQTRISSCTVSDARIIHPPPNILHFIFSHFHIFTCHNSHSTPYYQSPATKTLQCCNLSARQRTPLRARPSTGHPAVCCLKRLHPVPNFDLNAHTGPTLTSTRTHTDGCRLKLAAKQKSLVVNAASNNFRSQRKQRRQRSVTISRNRKANKVDLSKMDFIAVNIPGVPHLVGRREHY